MCTLWQQIGRAARGEGEEGVAIIFVEKADFDDQHHKKEAAKEKRQKESKRQGHR